MVAQMRGVAPTGERSRQIKGSAKALASRDARPDTVDVEDRSLALGYVAPELDDAVSQGADHCRIGAGQDQRSMPPTLLTAWGRVAPPERSGIPPRWQSGRRGGH